MNFVKEFACVEPTYVKKFQCDGRKCNAKCCRGWQVDIDRQTHERYKAISDPTMRKRVLDSLYWNEPSHSYRMNLDRSSCPMLRADLLCDIQKTFGAGWLSNTCAEFPRRTFVIDTLIERTLSMTCPVAAELALLDRSPLELKETTLRTMRAECFFYRSVHEMPMRKHLRLLQTISLDVFQDRRLRFNERLMALGIMMSEMDSIIAAGKENQLELIPRVYRMDDYFQSLTTKAKSMPFNLPYHVTMMFDLLSQLDGRAIAYYSSTQRVFTTYPLEAFRADETIRTWDQMRRVYDGIAEAYKEFVLEPYGHVIEKYAAHSFLAGLYPCHAPLTLLNNYFLYLTLWKLFEFGVMSMAAVLRERFTLGDLLEFIERMSNRVDHASLFQQITLDLITDKVGEPNELLSALIDTQI